MATGLDITAVIRSNVGPSSLAYEVIDKASMQAAPEAMFISLHGSSKLGVEIHYQSQETLGPDRLANALAAMALCEAPSIVVDCGTATKFEAVSKDVYYGGSIMPGIGMGAKALSQGTARLPEVALEIPKQVIGTDTSSAIQSGILFGHASAIDGMVSRLSLEMNATPKVFLTGGFASLVAPLCETRMQEVPTLTLDGIVEAGRRLGFR